ncbi:histone-like nucleoid-structuring protein, MvaT/MvaU family [Pseudomonas sp. BGr12]|uniref:histone-like nucleoid-structuring protein, MvaT/MvaU family n=1 Tax=Pseudomonas sp. BGr12 TaxID=2936269 RepID=UPI00255990C3|nr:histone-like nucleoid-structuring protein, MvaT/MvaU family [Pseudomonas sp. BJa5]MDL2428484.1 DNA binding protein [Pseudomonas sp. BJa5]
MSKIAEFRAAERALADQLAYLESLKHDSKLKKELEFEDKLTKLMKEYGKSLAEVISILDPSAASSRRGARAGTTQRKPRALKVYRNPETGEVVETKGGNHRTLKAWKEQYGGETVESWLEQ